jgi:hypothetical protein
MASSHYQNWATQRAVRDPKDRFLTYYYWIPEFNEYLLLVINGHSTTTLRMSAFWGKADVIQGVAECPLIATSGHKDTSSGLTTNGTRERQLLA